MVYPVLNQTSSRAGRTSKLPPTTFQKPYAMKHRIGYLYASTIFFGTAQPVEVENLIPDMLNYFG